MLGKTNIYDQTIVCGHPISITYYRAGSLWASNSLSYSGRLVNADGTTYTFPSSFGSSGYALTTNGSGVLSWSAVATTASSVGGDLSGTIANAQLGSGVVGSSRIADLSIVDGDIANTTITYSKLNLTDGDIPQAKVNGLVTALGGKEPTITAGTTAQFWRGDKSWQTLNTTVVPEGTNLYFLDSRVRSALMTGYTAGSALALDSTDSLLQALGKLEGQIIANKSSFDGTGQWSKSGTTVYYNGGSVGVGTTNPRASLEVATDDFPGPGITGTSGVLVYNTNTSGNATAQIRLAAGTPVNSIWSLTSGGTAGDVFSIYKEAGTIGHKFTILDSGNVGIGTTAPSSKVDVIETDPAASWVVSRFMGNSTTTNHFIFQTNTDAGSAAVQVRTKDAVGKYAEFYVKGDGVEAGITGPTSKFVIDAGNVGVGTVNPETNLHIFANDSSVAELAITGSAQGSGSLYVGQSTDFGAGMLYNGDDTPDLLGSADDVVFFRRDAGVDYEVFKYRYNSSNVTFSGNVGIGTNAPAHTLAVNANIASGYTIVSNKNSAAGGLEWRWYSSSTGAPLGANSMCFGLGACILSIYSSGNATLAGT
ncbi:MAG: hypothetical protein NDI69_17370, partial [Bacteriovoracaceae bacterium]|nr:hypothetical protein [Bacteriovoracaceae bacterium]